MGKALSILVLLLSFGAVSSCRKAADVPRAPVKAATPPLLPEGKAKEIDAIFSAWNHRSTPGAAVAVIKNGQIIYNKGYGSANLEYNIPITPDTIFHVASVSKEFTAMAIVLLEEDGKLSIDDDVHKYLPELPDYGAKITLRNLLQHTSGIRDQWQTLALAGWGWRDVITQDQILRVLFRQKELNFAPSTRWLYSNSGFTLLAEIVRRVSGKPLPEFCAARIFGPLGMSRTHFHADVEEIVPDRAYSYNRTFDGSGTFKAAPLNYANVGATSLFTTAHDLVLWLDNFRTGRVGGQKAIARLQEEGVLKSGKKTRYAMGLDVETYRGLRVVDHAGGDAGYRAYVIWFPGENVGVAATFNDGFVDPGETTTEVADVVLDGAFKEPAKHNHWPAKFATIPGGDFTPYVGRYQADFNRDFVVTLTADGNKLYARELGDPADELHTVSPGEFVIEAVPILMTFDPLKDGVASRLTYKILGANIRMHRIPDESTVPMNPPDYIGEYRSDEVDATYVFSVRDSRLVGWNLHNGEFALSPLSPDKFLGGIWFAHEVTFQRDSFGRVVAVVLGGDRLTGIRFDRRPGGSPPAAVADYAKELGAPDDGLFRPSADLPGAEEAYLPPLFASSHAANLLLLKSGDLLCAWFTGAYEGLSDGAIAIARLPRNGSRWSRPAVVDHRVGESFQNPVLFQAPDGTVWLFHTTQPAGQGQSHARVFATQSKDGGLTWSPPHLLFAEPGAFVRHPPLVLPDGRWLLPMYFTPQLGATFTGGWKGAENDHSTIKISGDGGLHWSDHPVPESAGLVQPEVVRSRDGGYTAFFRSRFADFIYRAESADGATWTPPRPTPLPSNNSSFQLVQLDDGSTILAFNNAAARTGEHRPQTAARWPLSVALSEDGGRTWKSVRDLETGGKYPHSNAPELPQPDRVGRKEYSYPSVQAGADGKIYVAYTYLRYTIKVVRFDEGWIGAGSTSGLFRPTRIAGE